MPQGQIDCTSTHTDEEKQTESVPECVYAVDAARHVLSVINVCGFRVEDLKQSSTMSQSKQHFSRFSWMIASQRAAACVEGRLRATEDYTM